MSSVRLELQGVSRSVAGTEVLRDIDLDLEVRGVVVIAGRSGSGKSSLLRLLNRLDAPTTGRVCWDGEDIATADICRLRRRVGHVAQRPVMFEGSALDNLAVADPALTRSEGLALLGTVGLADQADQDARTLSGGEAQRLCVARTLATEPEVILADEPTASLDAAATAEIESLTRELAATRGVAWIWVSHDPAQMHRLADIALVMADGRLVAEGTLDELRRHDDATVRQAVGAR